MEIDAVENLARHRIEKRFRAFGLFVIDKERDVTTLDLLPAVIVDPVAAELALQQ